MAINYNEETELYLCKVFKPIKEFYSKPVNASELGTIKCSKTYTLQEVKKKH